MSAVAEAFTLLAWHGWIGMLGVFLYVFAYALLQLGSLRADTYRFCLLNGLGGLCVLISLSHAFNFYSAVIQLLWVALSVIGMVRLWLIRRRLHFSADEEAFLADALPGIERADARALLDRAQVLEIEPAVELTEQGEEITHLVYLIEGEAEVRVGGTRVATLGPGQYIGDVTYREPQPASATVLSATRLRTLSFEIDTLRGFLAGHDRIRHALEASAADNLRHKLKAANAAATAGTGPRGAQQEAPAIVQVEPPTERPAAPPRSRRALGASIEAPELLPDPTRRRRIIEVG